MIADHVKRRLAAVLALDVAGYSRLMGLDEEGTHSRFMAVMRKVVLPQIAAHGGHVIKNTGDGVLVEFDSVNAAMAAAVVIQRIMRARAAGEPTDRRIEFRMGITLGDVIIEPDEIYGDGVNIAARLQELAEPGSICISQTVAEQVIGKMDIRHEDLGERQLKNISRPIHVFRVDPPEGEAGGEDPVLMPALTTPVPGFRDRPVIAVLPFANLSDNREHEYFADGLTEDIITMLASWRSFPVIARNSVFAYKGRDVDIRTVGKELGAQYVLEGSVRRDGNRVRITSQLIEAETNTHIFAERHDQDLTDVFAVQDEIVTKIVGALEPELARAEGNRAVTTPQFFSAYDFLQRGLWHHHRYSAEDNLKAQALFRQSLALDENYVEALAALAVTQLHRVVHKWQPGDQKVHAETLALARKAVSIDPRAPQAHYALAACYLHTSEIQLALHEMEGVIHLNPSHAVAHANLGNLYNYVNKPELALRSVMTAMRLSPNDARQFIWVPALAGSYYLSGRYADAITAGRRGYALKPDYVAPLRYVVAALGQLGRGSEAAEFVSLLKQSDGDLAGMERYLGRYYVDDGALKHILDGLRKAGLT